MQLRYRNCVVVAKNTVTIKAVMFCKQYTYICIVSVMVIGRNKPGSMYTLVDAMQ
jgi:hypothetical protein